MKQKDLALIVVIIIFSTVISVLLSNLIFASPANREQQVEVVQPITDVFNKPDKRYFNQDAVNPTRIITINPNSNQNPFSSVKPQ